MVILDRGGRSWVNTVTGVVQPEAKLYFEFGDISTENSMYAWNRFSPFCLHEVEEEQTVQRGCQFRRTNLKWKVPSLWPKPLPGTRQIPSSSSSLIQ